LLFLVILTGVIQICVSVYVLPRFSDMFADILGDRPFPRATAIMFKCRWAMAVVTLILSAIAVSVVQRQASVRYLSAFLSLLFLQIGLTIFALILPLKGVFQVIAPTR